MGFYSTTPGSQYWVIETTGDGVTLQFYSQTDRSLGVAATIDEWLFLAIRRNGSLGGEAVVIKAGTMYKNEDDTSNYSTQMAQLTFGNYYDDAGAGSDSDFAGIKFWDAYLTDAELWAESAAIIPKRWANLNRWTPALSGTIADAVKDFSGNARDFSYSGAPTVVDGPPVSYGASPIIVPQFSSIVVPTLSAAGAQDITATTARPKVTFTF